MPWVLEGFYKVQRRRVWGFGVLGIGVGGFRAFTLNLEPQIEPAHPQILKPKPPSPKPTTVWGPM